MAKPEFFRTPGYGESAFQDAHYSQAVKVGNLVETSGQGGWDDNGEFPASMSIADEIAQAFRNVGRTLATAGAGWEHVIAVKSYHVPLDDEAMEVMINQFRHHMPNHGTTWTCLGVVGLAYPQMRVEIRATAIIPE